MATLPLEAKALDEDLNGLATTIKLVVDENLADPATRRHAAGLNGSLVVREPRVDVAATLAFSRDGVTIANGATSHPSAYLEAKFEELADISSGQLGPVWAVLTRRVKARGNLFFLLSVSRLLIYKE